jgi:hypothetical protein
MACGGASRAARDSLDLHGEPGSALRKSGVGPGFRSSVPGFVARMERSAIRERHMSCSAAPNYAALHPKCRRPNKSIACTVKQPLAAPLSAKGFFGHCQTSARRWRNVCRADFIALRMPAIAAAGCAGALDPRPGLGWCGMGGERIASGLRPPSCPLLEALLPRGSMVGAAEIDPQRRFAARLRCDATRVACSYPDV